MSQRVLTVKVIGDDRDVQRMWGRQARQAKTAETSFVSSGRALKAGLAGAGVAIGLQETIQMLGRSAQAASDLAEEGAKSQEVFGESARGIRAWADQTAGSIGIARNEALKATGVFGNLFGTVGIGQKDAADMSRVLVELAADLASFNNANPEDVLNAIRSGLIGEAEPLRRYGVLLSEARVQQVALATTGKDNVKALTDQEKAQARYAIILQDTQSAQGDVERTSDSLANQQRRLAAETNDLAADFGGVLVPAMQIATITALGFVQGIGGLIDGMRDLRQEIRDSDAFDGWNEGVQEAQSGFAGFLLDVRDSIPLLERFKRATQDAFETDSPFESGTQPGVGGGQRARSRGQRANAIAEETEQEIRDAERAFARRRKAFDAFVTGMGLKLDRAELTSGFADDIAALEELEAAILRQIDREGRTFDLVSQLTDTRLQLSAIQGRAARAAADASRDAYEDIIDALDLNLTQAMRTASLEDDLAALAELERVIRQRIVTEGRTIDLLRELDRVQAQRDDALREQRERRQGARRGRQFEALGLTDEGQERTPGAGALTRRADRLENRIKGTVLDTQATRSQLDRIQAVLSGKFGEVGKNVREAIEGMLDEIAGALEGDGKGGTKRKGPLTATSGLNTAKILEGMGLSEEEIRELRGRLSSVNSAGRILSSPARTAGTGAGPPTGRHIEIDNYVTVEIDGRKVSGVVTKQQQKQRRRNPKQKRGPNRR